MLLKLGGSKKYPLFILFFLLSLVFTKAIEAVPIYNPGDTLDPACLPSNSDCTVTPPMVAWILQANTVGDTNVASNNTVNFINGVGISLSQSGSNITINNVGVGSSYTAGLGLNLSSNTFSLNLGSSNVWTGLQTFNGGIDVIGNVGIGTTNPNYSLDILNSANMASGMRITNNSSGSSARTRLILGDEGGDKALFNWNNSDNSAGIGTINNRPFNLYQNSLSVLTINSGGNVGINNSSPSFLFDVSGTGNFTTLAIGGTVLETSSGSLLYGNGLSFSNLNIGTSNQVLMSNGAAPTWMTVAGLGQTYSAGIGLTSPSTGIIALNLGNYNVWTGLQTFNGGIGVSGPVNISSASTSTWTLASAVNSLNFGTNILSLDGLNNRIGIGTSTPGFTLSVMGSQVSGNIVAMSNLSSGTGPSTSILRMNMAATTGGGANSARFVQFYSGSTTDNNGTGVGNIRLNNAGVTYGSGNADLAEWTDVVENVDNGDIISSLPTGNKKALIGNLLLGVVTDTAAFIGNETADLTGKAIVGMLGRVNTHVSTENGNISIGDPIAASSVAGVGMKQTKAGPTIGKALMAFSGVGVTRIAVQVVPGWYDPDPLLTLDSFSVGVSGEILDRYNTTVTRAGGFDGVKIKEAIISKILTLNNEAITDLTGNGLTLSSGSLTLDLGDSNIWTGLQIFNNLAVGNTNLITNLNANYLNGISSTYLPYVNDVTDTSFIRSGSGPYTVALNLGNSNVWTAIQSFTNYVGIGTTAPTEFLQIGENSGDIDRFMMIAVDSQEQAGIKLKGGSSGEWHLTHNDTDSDFRIGLDANELFTLKSTGFAALGGSTPESRLTIQDTDSGVVVNSDYDDFLIENNGNSGMVIGSSSSGIGSIYFGDNGSAIRGGFKYNHSSEILSFFAGGSERIFVNGNTGNIDVGATGNFATLSVGGTVLEITSGSLLYGNGFNFSNLNIGISGQVLMSNGSTPVWMTIAGLGTSGASYTAGIGLTLSSGNVFALNLGSSNVWTGLQTFNSGIGVSGNATFANYVGIGTTAPIAGLHAAVSAAIFGSGENGTPSLVTIRGAAGAGSNITGADINFDASNGTGAGGSGNLVFRTATGDSSNASIGTSTVTGLIPSTNTYTFAHTIPTSNTNRMLTVQVYLGSSQSVSNMTYGGVSMTGPGTSSCVANNGSGVRTEVWYLINPPTGNNNVVINFGAYGQFSIAAINVTGASQSIAPVCASATGGGNNGTVSVTSAISDLVVDASVILTSGTMTPGVSQSTITSTQSSFYSYTSTKKIASSTSTNMSWTYGGWMNWALVAMSIKPSSSSNNSNTFAERLRITPSGKIGVGTASPGYTFDVSGTGNFTTLAIGGTVINNTSGSLLFGNGTSFSNLNIGTSNQILMSNGSTPVWVTTSALNLGSSNTWTGLQTFNGGISTNTIKTVSGYLTLNSGTSTPDLLVLDNGTSDPTGTNGAMYYNDSLNKFRCYENGAWRNCTGSNTTGVGTTFGPIILQTGSTLLSTITVTPSTAGGDIYMYADLFTNSLAGTNQTITAEIRSGTTCNGTLLAEGVADLTGGNGTNGPSVLAATLIQNPGATAQNYAICGKTTSAGDANTRGIVSAIVIDTGADLAEIYTTNDSNLEMGDVVSLDSDLKTGMKKSQKAYDQSVLGIVSGKPGLLIGDVDSEGVKVLPVALSGRVPVKATTENGPIKVGDLLTTASTPGVAMRANKAGAIIGTAMSDFDGEGTGQVLVFIKNGSGLGKVSDLLPGVDENGTTNYSEQILDQLMWQKNNLAVVNLSEILTDRLVAGVEIITPRVLTDKVQTKNLCVGDGESETCISKSQLDQILSKFDIGNTETVVLTPTGVGITLNTTLLTE